ncbi:methyltransferase domain-containing protein [Bradymonas sediminis]|nr:methyltransferase domain-containing protein [Bradymonas sediminis]TDP64368.1 methyltransferase family protein [Bradymonas sediminis]
MLSKSILELLACPTCNNPQLQVGSARRPALVCEQCDQAFPIVDGIIDMTPSERNPAPGSYRTETLFNLIAGIYDLVAPLMSMGVWRCDPLRYVDMSNQALGRGNKGVVVAAPIGTGMPLDRVLAPYHDLTLIGVDQSWKMLRKAKSRFAASGEKVQLIRADFQQLPFRDGVVDSLISFHGLHTFADRTKTLREFGRCLRADGFMTGAALVRGQEGVADTLLDRYERYGVYPLLRTAEFLTRELREGPFQEVRFSTYGAVMFYSALRNGLEQAHIEDAS